MNGAANRLARALRERGAGPDERVAVCIHRGPEMVVALLAALKAGAGYVPLDPAHPDERIRFLLADTAPAVLVTEARLSGRFADAAAPVVQIDGNVAAWAHHSAADLDPAETGVGPGHLAYVIHTSGSTGVPRGVMVEHRNLAHLVAPRLLKPEGAMQGAKDRGSRLVGLVPAGGRPHPPVPRSAVRARCHARSPAAPAAPSCAELRRTAPNCAELRRAAAGNAGPHTGQQGAGRHLRATGQRPSAAGIQVGQPPDPPRQARWRGIGHWLCLPREGRLAGRTASAVARHHCVPRTLANRSPGANGVGRGATPRSMLRTSEMCESGSVGLHLGWARWFGLESEPSAGQGLSRCPVAAFAVRIHG